MPPNEWETTETEATQSPKENSEPAAPSPIPPPRKRGRPSIAEMAAREGMTETEYRAARGMNPTPTKTKASPSNQTIEGKVTRRSIDDAPDREKAIKPYKMFARMAVKLVDKIYELTDMGKLDDEEREAGIEAFSTLLYEESAKMSGRILVVTWLGMTAVPRAIVRVDKAIEERKKTKEQRLLEATKPKEEKKDGN